MYNDLKRKSHISPTKTGDAGRENSLFRIIDYEDVCISRRRSTREWCMTVRFWLDPYCKFYVWDSNAIQAVFWHWTLAMVSSFMSLLQVPLFPMFGSPYCLSVNKPRLGSKTISTPVVTWKTTKQRPLNAWNCMNAYHASFYFTNLVQTKCFDSVG